MVNENIKFGICCIGLTAVYFGAMKSENNGFLNERRLGDELGTLNKEACLNLIG
jgi:hypothetical protein